MKIDGKKAMTTTNQVTLALDIYHKLQEDSEQLRLLREHKDTCVVYTSTYHDTTTKVCSLNAAALVIDTMIISEQAASKKRERHLVDELRTSREWLSDVNSNIRKLKERNWWQRLRNATVS